MKNKNCSRWKFFQIFQFLHRAQRNRRKGQSQEQQVIHSSQCSHGHFLVAREQVWLQLQIGSRATGQAKLANGSPSGWRHQKQSKHNRSTTGMEKISLIKVVGFFFRSYLHSSQYIQQSTICKRLTILPSFQMHSWNLPPDLILLR